LNTLTASKLDLYLSTLFEGQSETANKGETFNQHVWNEKNKHHFIDEIIDIALSATHIPLSILTIYFATGLKSIQCWNERLKHYISSILKWRQSHMTFSFFLKIFLYKP
jgi:hypothetical protein